MGDQTRAVKIQATYWISSSSDDGNSAPTRIQTFGPSSPSTDTHTNINTPLRVGLPDGAKPDKGSGESYSGVHDQGPLPPLREGGPMAVLLSCLQEAKKFNDQYLTERIAAQLKTETKAHHNQEDVISINPLKRPKVGDDADKS